MAISGKCGKVHIPRIGEEEPVFILRAQDQLAVYATRCINYWPQLTVFPQPRSWQMKSPVFGTGAAGKKCRIDRSL